MRASTCILFLSWLAAAGASAATAAAPTADMVGFNQKVKPLLESHCVACHGPEKEKGKLRVDKLNPDLFTGNDGERWQDVLDQLNCGDMPPKDAKQKLDRTQREAMTGWLQGEMKLAAEVRSGTSGRATIRRLTKYEFDYSLRDLLKVNLDFAKNLPDDRAGVDGLRNNAVLLGMTPTQFELASGAAETALRKAMVTPVKPQVFKYHVEPEKGEHQTKMRSNPGEVAGNAFRLYPGRDYAMAFAERPREGRFQIRARVGARPDANGVAPELQVWLGYQVTGRVVAREMLAELPVTAPIESPEVMTLEGFMENVPMAFEAGGGEAKQDQGKKKKDIGAANRGLIVWLVAAGEGKDAAQNANKGKRGRNNKAQTASSQGADSQAQQIMLDWVEYEGPYFESWPPASRVACVGTNASPSDARVALQAFASRAWRRPVTAAEVEPLVASFNRVFAANHDHDAAMRAALALVISSPDFLYLIEPAGEQSRSLNAHELAARLSYFLWASLPDDALRQDADSGRLLEKTAFTAQVRRMLADPKAHRFATHFTEQWLGVDQIGRVAVNPEYYPAFHPQTKTSLEREPGEFFWHVLSQKRSAMDFLDSDYVVVDETLARHYRLKGVSGPDFRAVKVGPQDHRGGMLGMGGFMLAQSNGSQSHPIFRGKWVLGNLLNTPPPAPPPNVPQLDQADPKFAKLSLKDQLAFHRQNAACASCHDKLDPYGLALENFDAVGQWRQSESRLIASANEDAAPEAKGKKRKKAAAPAFENVPVNAAVKLADNTPVNGFAELKAYLLRTKQDVFAEGLVRKLLAYALGRSLNWTDQAEIARLKQSFASSGYKLDALITEIAFSAPFRTK